MGKTARFSLSGSTITDNKLNAIGVVRKAGQSYMVDITEPGDCKTPKDQFNLAKRMQDWYFNTQVKANG